MTYGDADGDGFIEYARRSESGLIQQGWKDSWDSVFHADGTLAEPPIALCEIQGYALRRVDRRRAAGGGTRRHRTGQAVGGSGQRAADAVRARVPCAIGAPTSRIGSFAKSGVPLGTA